MVLTAAFALGAPGLSHAQLVTSRDLTSGVKFPSEHIAAPDPASCPKPDATMTNGSKAEPASPHGLELVILSVSPRVLSIGKNFVTTLRLKNIGTEPVLVPALMDGDRALHANPENNQEEYEVADITLALKTGAGSVPVFLSSSGALFADPQDPASHISLAPGAWMEIKTPASVTCGMQHCVGGVDPDPHAALTAWWYQRTLGHTVKGCSENHSSTTIAEVYSAPFTIAVGTPVRAMNEFK
jgi:hypothetical protein